MSKRNFKVTKLNEVNRDLQEIVDYYNDKKDFLGNEFFAIALKQMKQLKSDALLYSVKYMDVRCVSVAHFPYLIHYRVDQKDNSVKILAVIGMRQDPDKKWGER